MPLGNYELGKRAETDSWSFLERIGYHRTNKEERQLIARAHDRCGRSVERSGFDAIRRTDVSRLRNLAQSPSRVESITLFEVKTAGRNRAKPVGARFQGLGFTLTSKEKRNAEILGRRYRFLLVDLACERCCVCSLGDFFDPRFSRIYETWSVFINANGIGRGARFR